MLMGMRPERIYEHPTWSIALTLVGLSVAGAIVVELIARSVLPIELRRRHNDVGAAILGIVGLTYGVLLAFVAMLAWDIFKGAEAASHREAAAMLDVAHVAQGMGEPMRHDLRQAVLDYGRTVIDQEWPSQAAGQPITAGASPLEALGAMAARLGGAEAVPPTLQAAVLDATAKLSDARQERLLAATSSLPGVMWYVLVLGGGLTVLFASLLGAPSVFMQLAMASALAASGALVLTMIIALSEPFRGDFRVSPAAYTRAMTQIGPAEPLAPAAAR